MADRDYTIVGPGGRELTITGPDNATPDQLRAAAERAFGTKPVAEPGIGQRVMQQVGNLGAGLVRGAGSIGATLVTPYDLAVGNTKSIGNPERRQAMDEALGMMGADTNSLAYGGGKMAGEIAGTLGAGGAAANALSRVPGMAAAAPNVINAVRTSGMTAGTGGGVSNALARTAGGATTGALAAGAVNPDDAMTGAVVGGALPGAIKVVGKAGELIGKGARAAVGEVTPEVAALAQRAKALGIEIPADRLVDSKPMNAAAASLNYVPFSGRAATEAKMASQLDRAVSRTFGQNSDNVTQALRQASATLGSQFDTVLQNNTVKLTPSFKTALANAENQATSELGAESASIIHKQIAQIQAKAAATGEIDGQAAYNIKKTLDCIGNRNAPEAYYARELKKSLMDALNDSLGPQQAASFAKVRQQYGNMLELEGLAQNGAEGGISIARLANLKNINNPDLQELADIAAQFMRTRESPHGAMQRLVIGGAATGAAGGMGALAALPVAVAAGRGGNALLNSQAARNAILGQPSGMPRLMNDQAAQLAYRAAPLLAGGR